MSHRYPPRRRDQHRPDDDFMTYEPYQSRQQPYEAYDPYEEYAPRSSVPAEPQSAPRRRKSERHRRAPSPIYYADEPSTSRRHGQYQPWPEEDGRGRSAGPDRRARNPSPPPIVAQPDPPRRKGRSSRPERESRHKSEPRYVDPYEQDSRRTNEPRFTDPYEQDSRRKSEPRFADPYEQDDFYTRGSPPRHYPAEPRAAPPRERDLDRDAGRDRSHRSRPPARDFPEEPRSRGRSSRHADMGDDDGYVTTSRRRPKSPTRSRQDRAASGPSPTRGRPPPTSRAREPTTKRRSSMPATAKGGIPWWQNPLIQAGARTALTAGAQAAMKSKGDQGAWLGAKGAKVATAALGAALVDGFIGQKHPGGTRHNIAKQGVDLASSKAATGAERVSRHHR